MVVWTAQKSVAFSPGQVVQRQESVTSLNHRQVTKKNSKGKKTTSRGRPPQAVKLDNVVSQLTNETYQIVGRVVALQSGDISARVGGTIKKNTVAVGDRVTKGSIKAIGIMIICYLDTFMMLTGIFY